MILNHFDRDNAYTDRDNAYTDRCRENQKPPSYTSIGVGVFLIVSLGLNDFVINSK